MKRILITGSKGYIASSLKEWLETKGIYDVDLLNVRDEKWLMKSFSSYQAIIHTAALVHSSQSKRDYDRVNVELSLKLAKKAKREGVKQFIFLSTMGVYGHKPVFINEKTPLHPETYYALSKYQAEIVLDEERTEDFKIAIIRPPLVYGKKSPGNYDKISKLAKVIPIFPKVANKRSMIFINNLTEFITLLIEHESDGLFFPQNQKYVNTSELVQNISKANGKKLYLIVGLTPLIKGISKKFILFQKIFGDYQYSLTLPGGPDSKDFTHISKYETVDFKNSVILSEREK